jgi:hypothetical protein
MSQDTSATAREVALDLWKHGSGAPSLPAGLETRLPGGEALSYRR